METSLPYFESMHVDLSFEYRRRRKRIYFLATEKREQAFTHTIHECYPPKVHRHPKCMVRGNESFNSLLAVELARVFFRKIGRFLVVLFVRSCRWSEDEFAKFVHRSH